MAEVLYAAASDGQQLPIIDVTHPVFAVKVSDAELAALCDEFVRQARAREWIPAVVSRAFYRLALRRSVLARGIVGTAGSFLSGMNTYLLKLGPDSLGPAASPIDRRVAASLPALSVRLRLQDVAQLVAGHVGPRLDTHRDHPCRFLNIGGGPAIDSLNALLLLKQERPERLGGRLIQILVFDLDEAGPSFGARALKALMAPGAPLHALDIRFERVPYDWQDYRSLAATLSRIITPRDVVAVSSEGALFEYGSDEVVVGNLDALRRAVPADACVAGSVTRDDGPATYLNRASRVPLKPRSLAAFEALAHRGGWRVARVIERPFSRNVILETGLAG